jgi:imidazolonepropionase-like amidohydrolase
MRYAMTLLGLAAAALAFQGSVIPKPTQAPVVAFVDVHVIPMNQAGMLDHQTVIVRGNRIVTIGPVSQVHVVAGATIIDGRGKYLMPGLGEMHGHLPSPSAGPELTENLLFLYVANGVTTVRGMQGTLTHLELKARIARGELLGPQLWVSGPPLTGNAAPTPEAGRRLVEEQRASGFDELNIDEGLGREAYDTIVAAARRLGMRFGGRVPASVGLQHVLKSGQASIDDLDDFVQAVGGGRGDSVTEARISQVAATTCAARTWTVPTLLDPEDSARASRPELRYVPAAWRSSWAQQPAPGTTGASTLPLRRRILKALQAAGCPIAVGTDSPSLYSVPGFSMQRQMYSMAAAGFSPQQILGEATREVARYFGAEQEFGSVAPGQRADLLLLNGNPLSDLKNVGRRAGVMVSGRWLPEAEIQARLERIATAYQ